MPFFPQVTGDAHGIRQVHTEHSCGGPAVQKPGIRRVAAVRVPDRCEVGRALIGAVVVIFESEGGALAADAAVQQSPEAFVPEFREIGHSILRCRDGRALRGRYSGRYFLLNSVPAFHGSCSRCG